MLCLPLQLDVIASDRRGKTAGAVVEINIRRLAVDQPPKFTEDVYRRNVLINQPAGTFVLQVSATDPDIPNLPVSALFIIFDTLCFTIFFYYVDIQYLIPV